MMDGFIPNCLVYRYAGSDLLEPAMIVKEGKKNFHVATRPQELARPVAVPKDKVYAWNEQIYGAIAVLRAERKDTIARYDTMIQAQWQHLQPLRSDP